MKVNRLRTYIVTISIFLVIDVIWLSIMTELFYRPALGGLLSESPRLLAAAIFYIVYAIGAAELILIRGQKNDNSGKDIFQQGALLGMLAYGTYEMTNYATIDVWPLSVVMVDIIWGAVLTGSVLLLSSKVLK